MATRVIKQVSMPYFQAFDRLCDAIQKVGYSLNSSNKLEGEIQFGTPFCFTDYGYLFTVKVGAIDMTTTQFVFDGATIGVSLGRGKKKVEKIMALF